MVCLWFLEIFYGLLWFWVVSDFPGHTECVTFSVVCLWFVYGLSMIFGFFLWFTMILGVFGFPWPHWMHHLKGRGCVTFSRSEKPICGIPARLKNLERSIDKYRNINWLNCLNCSIHLQLLLCGRYLKRNIKPHLWTPLESTLKDGFVTTCGNFIPQKGPDFM